MTAEQARAEHQKWAEGQYDRVMKVIEKYAFSPLQVLLLDEKLTDETIERLTAEGYSAGFCFRHGVSWEPPKTVEIYVEGNTVPIASYTEGEVEQGGGIAEVVKPRKLWFNRLFN